MQGRQLLLPSWQLLEAPKQQRRQIPTLWSSPSPSPPPSSLLHPQCPNSIAVEIFPSSSAACFKWWASSSPAWGGNEGHHRRRELPFDFCRSSEGVDKGRWPMAGCHVCSSHPGFYTTRTPIPRLEQPLPAQIHWPFSFKSSIIECVSKSLVSPTLLSRYIPIYLHKGDGS